MNHTTRYMQIISGQDRSAAAGLIRMLLRIAAWLYGYLIAVRNWYHDALKIPTWLDVPVISVGNLTVGGTGKTPMTLWLCHRLVKAGYKPAVLSRGYKASSERLADELLMVSRQCPEAVAIANPDRAAAGFLAVGEYAATVAVLDDGFQHRRLGRDFDIVLIDATRPLGYGYLLPRGLLREPPESLRRAEAVVVTRCDQCESGRISQIVDEVHRINPEVPIVRAVHQPIGFADLGGQSVSPPVEMRIGCFAGIARPESFQRTLEAMHLTPSETKWWPDHHVYTEPDIAMICSWAKTAGFDALVTTEKDAVKLTALAVDWPIPVLTLRIEMAMLDDGEKILGQHIDAVLKEHADMLDAESKMLDAERDMRSLESETPDVKSEE